MTNDIFRQEVESMRDLGFNPYPDRFTIKIPDAKQVLLRGLRYYLGDEAQWIPAYNDIADWLSDNKGKGLLCVGNCGLGKTLICSNIIPVILHHYYRKCVSLYDAQAMNTCMDEIKNRYIASIDDIGTESDKMHYGERRVSFSEIVDSAEKKSHMLILTTNLTTVMVRDDNGNPIGTSIEERYGLRTLDRLKAITKVVIFNGRSLRK